MSDTTSDAILDALRSRQLNVLDFINSQDVQTIRDRILARVPDDLDKSQGSYIWDAIEPTDIEFMRVYFLIMQIVEIINPETAYGAYLTGQAMSHGTTRNPATYASGNLLVTGEKGTVIPVGTKFSTTIPAGSGQTAKYFSVTEQRTIDSSGQALVPVVADEPGSAYNVAAGEVNLNASGVRVVTSVSNPEPFTNGADEESDEHLRERWFTRVRNPISGGNRADYKTWAMEVPGVGNAIVTPLWNGPGTVRVAICGMRGEPVPDLIQAVKDYIDPLDGMGEGKAPIGAIVTVVSVASRTVNITIPKMQLEEGYDLASVKAAIHEALEALFAELVDMIRVKEVEATINNVPGVLDFEDVLLDGASENIPIETEQKASVGEVIYRAE